MSRFVVTLPAAHRVMLENYRKALGLRSEAEALRHLIDTYAPALAITTAEMNAKTVADHVFGSREAQHQRLTAMSALLPPPFGNMGPTTFHGVDALSGEPLPDRKPYQKTEKK